MDADSEKARFEFVRRVQRDTRICIDRVIRESDRSRALLETSERERRRLLRRLETVSSERDELALEVEELRKSLVAMEAEHESILVGYADFEAQTTNLANLYVATYRLHGAADRDEVLDVIEEIVVNLIGSEEIAVLMVDPVDSQIRVVRARGLGAERFDCVVPGVGAIGRSLAFGQAHFARPGQATEHSSAHPLAEERDLSACVPLRVCGEVVGALAIYRLLPQKPGLEPIDLELLALMGEQAGVALVSAAHLAGARRSSSDGRGL